MNPIVKKIAINFGLIGALVSIVYHLIAYVIGPHVLVKWWPGTLVLLISIAILIYVVIRAKNELGGYLSFKDGFSTFFLTMFIATSISTLFTITLMNVVDSDYRDKANQITLEFSIDFMDKMNTPEDIIDESIRKHEEVPPYSVKGLFRAFMVTIMLGALLALIVAAFVKKRNPELEG
jgi:hypothetical protein